MARSRCVRNAARSASTSASASTGGRVPGVRISGIPPLQGRAPGRGLLSGNPSPVADRQGMQAETALREIRESIRDAGLLPPQLPAELAWIDEPDS
jgi:hypothetical protein